MSTTRTQATPKQMDQMRCRLNKFWLPIKNSCLPPQDEMVLVRYKTAGDIKLYMGRFQYDKGDATCTLGKWHVPLAHAKAHGLIGWMPLPA